MSDQGSRDPHAVRWMEGPSWPLAVALTVINLVVMYVLAAASLAAAVFLVILAELAVGWMKLKPLYFQEDRPAGKALVLGSLLSLPIVLLLFATICRVPMSF